MYRAFWDTIFLLSGYLFTYSQVPENSTSTTTMAMTPTTTTTTTTIITATNTTAVSNTTVKKKFLVAAVHSHFADCPDSHTHFCFHGTCRFLILEKTPACVCHPGFIGVRCEHADLLAVVATNQTQQTLATILMLCILGSVLLVLLCTIINFWWRRGRWRRGPLLSCLTKKPNGIVKNGTSCCHSETVV
ncbi:protransforming growth factor alpha [Hemibagrus wyckioides]|uniref:protransforming growth factor alpha n=1 Tax=Hemibagrus wyckioides TaxID=337641 RepID=UPI00266C071D|nr:protransforming growth factor alpha [Hemibagrus wyckioides]